MPLIQTKGAGSAQGFGEFTAGAPKNYIEDVFSTYLYTGTGANLTITNGIDLSGKGGLVWGKNRNGNWSHYLADTARGTGKFLESNTTSANILDSTSVTAFNTTGFSIGNAGAFINNNGVNYVSWTFRKQPKFFDVVTYTGNGSSLRSLSHSLGSAPGFIVVKKTSAGGDNWGVYHRDLPAAGRIVYLDSTFTASDGYVGFTAPTSSIFYVGGGGSGISGGTATSNDNGATYVAYLFAHNAGGFGLTGSDNVISCGSYAGSNNPSYPTPGAGRTVTLGYEPQFVLIKNTTTAGMNWVIMDNMRLFDLSGFGWIFPNSSGAEQSGSDVYVSPTATGFRTYGNNATVDGGSTSETFVYIAIRRGPMKVPTVGTTVFSPTLNVSPNPIFVSNFPVDSQWLGNRTSGDLWYQGDRLRGANYLQSNTTAAESSSSVYKFDYQNGAINNFGGATSAYIGYSFRRAPSFFDQVCYTGTGSATTQTHNLGVIPELMIVKCRSNAATNWPTRTSALTATEYLILNLTDAKSSAGGAAVWNSTLPTSSVFSIGTDAGVNTNAATYVAYLFATCAGVSKVGSYTGTAALLTVNCGFTSGARFVLIKRTDSTGDWYVWDSARGISSSTDPYLLLNSTAAEVTGTNYVDTDTTGFKVTAAAPAGLNANGGTYIFLAIA